MKRASYPNASEQEHMSKVVEFGCIACYLLSGEQGTPAAIHHVHGSVRTSDRPEPHKLVLGLCGAHHQGTEKKPGGYIHGKLDEFKEACFTVSQAVRLDRACLLKTEAASDEARDPCQKSRAGDESVCVGERGPWSTTFHFSLLSWLSFVFQIG